MSPLRHYNEFITAVTVMGANTVCYVDANNDAGDRVDDGVYVDAGTGIDANIYMLICRQHCQIAAIRHHTLE